MRLMAFDPGQSTGWCALDLAEIGEPIWHAGVLRAGPPHHVELYGLLDTFMPEIVVTEHFVPQSRGGMNTMLELISRDYEGVIELWALQHHVKLVKQNAAEGKGFWTDAKLTTCALWKPSMHTRDAIRHMLHYMTFDRKDHQWLQMLRG